MLLSLHNQLQVQTFMDEVSLLIKSASGEKHDWHHALQSEQPLSHLAMQRRPVCVACSERPAAAAAGLSFI